MELEPQIQENESIMEHPLTRYLVLVNVFKYGKSRQAVLRNRLVCKSWKEASESEWLKLKKSPVLRYSNLPKSCEKSNRPLMTLQEYVIKYHKSSPPRKIELDNWKNFVGSSNVKYLDRRFWSLVGTGWLTTLTLTECHFHKYLPILEQPFLKALPNLENLTIKNSLVYLPALENVNKIHKEVINPSWMNWILRRNLKAAEIFRYQHVRLNSLDIDIKTARLCAHKPLKIWCPIFSIFPNLISLRLCGVIQDNGSPYNVAELVDALGCFGMNLKLTHLDLLDFSGKAQDYCIEDKKGWRFPNLKYLALDLGIFPVFTQNNFLPYTRGLTHLKLYRAPLAPGFLYLNWWDAVETLELWGNVDANLEFEKLGSPGRPRKLIWNTSCYDEKFKGKRIWHLLKEKRKSYPLFTKDLVMETRDHFLELLGNLTYLDIDFGPMSLESWDRLGHFVRGLTTLKAVFGSDRELRLASLNWPHLISLYMKHRSVLSPAALRETLVRLKPTLVEFCWKSCACTQPNFTNVSELRQVERLCESVKILELPWKWGKWVDELVCEDDCFQAEFERELISLADNWDWLMFRRWVEEYACYMNDDFAGYPIAQGIFCLLLISIVCIVYEQLNFWIMYG